MRSSSRRDTVSRLALGLAVVFAVGSVPVGAFQSEVMWNKSFVPGTIGPGSVSALTFAIQNLGPDPVTDLAFTDALPAGVTIATPAAAVTSCGGTLSAPAGGSTISFSDGLLAGSGSCAVSVNVTSSTPATHQNVSGDLTSSAGNSGSAIADLIVATDRPGFSKSFSPSTVGLGGRSTLTLTIDNTANPSPIFNMSFVDPLPVGMVVASPANLVNSCGGPVTATPGSSVVSLGFGGVLVAGGVCTVSVDVVANGVGELGNVTGPLTASVGGPLVTCGAASAVLDVTAGDLMLLKEFVDDPATPGTTTTLELTILNRSRSETATDITFTDDLDATLTGLVATGLPASGVCGPGSSLSGTSTLTLTGGTLAPESSCTFAVTLAVPAGAELGAYPNTTSGLLATLGGVPFEGFTASDTLFVAPTPVFSKEFTDDPVGAGGVVTLEFTISNPYAGGPLEAIAFTDELTTFLPAPLSVVLPSAGFCGAGATMSLVPLGTGGQGLSMTGGTLSPAGSPGDSCTFQVTVNIPAGMPSGVFTNITGPITAQVDTCGDGCLETVVGLPATDQLIVVAPPRLGKEFTDDPVQPGGTATLEFTLSHDELAPGDATAITFTDNLDAVLSGLVAVGLPANDVCGAGSQMTGTSTLTFTGGVLAPGEICTFSVTVQAPVDALPGSYTNITSSVVATVAGVSTIGNPASDDLRIAGLTLTKEFIDDPVLPGGTVTLRFTLDNASLTEDATAILFTDSLSAMVSGVTVDPASVPATPCGPSSVIALGSGNTLVTFAGGELVAGAGCTFELTLNVGAGVPSNTYGNTTSGFSATVGGSTVSFENASDTLEVNADLLLLTKEFTDDPVAPGDTVTLEFILANQSADESLMGITFTDDLDAALPGLAAIGLPLDDVCGPGSQLAGTSLLTLTGASLPAGGTCTISVTLQVPAAVPLGAVATNTTSSVSGMTSGEIAVTGGPASDDLLVYALALSKSFAGAAGATGAVDLVFTLENFSATDTVTGLAFTDDLDAVLPGLVATGLPLADVCGAGSTVSGSSFLTFSGGTLLPGGSCTFSVPVVVPAGTSPGSYPNTTSELTAAGLPAAAPATATLQVEPPPTFAKAFVPSATGVGLPATMTLTIDNSASAIAVTNLAFTDAFPAGLVLATPANAATTCGGTLTAVAGTGVLALTGGAVAAGASCTVQADVIATAPGALVNTTGDLTSTSGSSGAATATLVASLPPMFSKTFAPFTIAAGGTSTLTFIIDAGSSVLDATGLDFTDNLPAGVVVAAPANAATTCVGGTLTAVSGSGTISYTGGSVAANTGCTVSVDVTASTAGNYTNVSGELTSSLGSSGAATADLTVATVGLELTKAFVGDPVLRGGSVVVEYTISNSSLLDVADLAFTDDLGGALAGLAAIGLPSADVCGAGSTLTGTSVVTFTGGSLAAGASCTLSATVVVPADATLGTSLSTTGALTGTALGAPVAAAPAADDLTVVFLGFGKAFDGVGTPGGLVTLSFTLTNPDLVNGVQNLSFSDDLGAVLPGLVAIDLPAADVCGAGSALTGTAVIALTGGSLPPGGSCTFDVQVQIPAVAAAGESLNTTGVLAGTVGGQAVAGDPGSEATAPLQVLAIGIPALDPWGLAILILLIAGLGGWMIAGRRS